MPENDSIVLANVALRLRFHPATGAPIQLDNLLTDEVYEIERDDFAVLTDALRLDRSSTRLVALERDGASVRARYRHHRGGHTVEVAYTLRGDGHFAEKRIALTSEVDYGLQRVIASPPQITPPNPPLAPYSLQASPTAPPRVVAFGRARRGGFFVAMGLSFDSDLSGLEPDQLAASQAPSMLIRAGVRLESPPVFVGVYRHAPGELPRPGQPMRSELAALQAMEEALSADARGRSPNAARLCPWQAPLRRLSLRAGWAQ